MVFKARDEKQQFHSPSQKDKLFISLSLTLESSQGHATEPQPIKFGCLELSECLPFPLANELFQPSSRAPRLILIPLLNF
jgi:hypothetical protein